MSCTCQKKQSTREVVHNFSTKKFFIIGSISLFIWIYIYKNINDASRWFSEKVLNLDTQTQLGSSVEFFLYDVLKILMLLILMIYITSFIRAGMNIEKNRDFLAGKGKFIGYFLGSLFGAITPFCSCSSIPLFLGFTAARIPIGTTMAFLITSPLVNEVAVVLLYSLLGLKFTIIYISVGIISGIFGGMIMDAIRAGRWLQPFMLDALASGTKYAAKPAEDRHMDIQSRHGFAVREVKSIFGHVWLWVLAGVGLGAVLHGYVPDAWFAENCGAGQWWSVPLATTLGIPLYTNATGIVPVMESLLAKGLPVGTTLAFCMSSVAASLPEVLMLKQVMRWKLLAVFLGMLLVLFTSIGWLFNLINI